MTTRFAAPTLPASPSRMRCLGWSLVLLVTWPIGLALFVIWVVMMALSFFTFMVPVADGVTLAVRSYANRYRRWVGRATGVVVPVPYRTAPLTSGSSRLFERFVRIIRDPATWRDSAWLLVNATAGFALALIPVALFAGIWFYLAYPLLYALTPQAVFGTVFGVFELHSVTQAWIVTPMAVVLLALWIAAARPCIGLYLRLTRGMLRPVAIQDTGGADDGNPAVAGPGAGDAAATSRSGVNTV